MKEKCLRLIGLDLAPAGMWDVEGGGIQDSAWGTERRSATGRLSHRAGMEGIGINMVS